MKDKNLNLLFKKLDEYLKQKNLTDFVNNIFITIIFGLGVLFLISLIEYVFEFKSLVRRILFSILVISNFTFFIFRALLPLLKELIKDKYSRYSLAAKTIGNYFDQIRDKLLNTLQLIFEELPKQNYSKDLIIAAIHQNVQGIIDYNFNQVIDKRKVIKLEYISAFILISFLIIGFTFPKFPYAGYRVLHFNQEFEKAPPFYFIVEPGNKKIYRGESYFCRITPVGKQLKEIELNYAFEGMDVFERINLQADSVGSFNYRFNEPLKSFKFFASANGIKSKEYFVEVINFPIVKKLTVKVIPPSYTKLPIVFQEDDGNINTIYGSSIEIELTASKSLSDARIVFDDSTFIRMKINSEQAFTRFLAKRSGYYKMLIFDENGNSNLDPVTYQINLSNDEIPSITLLEPTGTVNLNDIMRVPLIFRVKDDYGFSRLTLNYRLSFSRYELPKEKYSIEEIQIGNSRDTVITYIWNLSKLNLVTDDIVSYYLEVFDNDIVSGPKSAKTPVMNVKLPSLDEILAENNEKFNNSIEETKNLLSDVEELKKEAEELDKQLKTTNNKLNWEEQKKAEELIKKHNEILQKIENLQDQINDLQNKLNENKTLSKETLQKFMELQELFNQLSSEEFKNAIQKLQEALNSINKQMLQEALKNFQFNDENFRASIERTIELLKRIQIEQKMDEALKRIENIQNKLDNLSEELARTNTNDAQKLNELADKQEQLDKELRDLEKNLEDLEQKMSEYPKEMPTEELKDLKDEFESNNNQQCSRKAAKDIREGKIESAKENQRNLKNSLSKLQTGLSQLKQQMLTNQMRTTLVQLQKISSDLISLSRQQEELKNNTKILDPSSQQINENLRKQSRIQDDLRNVIDRMIELSNKTFAITPEMGRAVGKAYTEMNEALQSLLNRNLSETIKRQTNAMGNLNEAADLIQGMMQNMMQGGQGAGMMSFMQRLQQMAQQQMNLNNLSQMLGQGELTMEQLAQLQRLAAEQEMIKKSLEELNREMREAGQSSRLLGDLEDVAKKMEEIIREMKANNLTEELIQKQEKILTRLLDAQRSLNERDYEKRRESKTGEQLTTKPPADLKFDENTIMNKIRQDLLRALEEGFAKDYELLIRKYFEALQQEKLINQ